MSASSSLARGTKVEAESDGSTTTSPASTSDSDSSTDYSSSDDSSSSSSGEEDASPQQRRAPSSSSGGAAVAGELHLIAGLPALEANQTLQFARPDATPIDGDAGSAGIFTRLFSYPWKQLRAVDYLRYATRQFVVTLRKDYNDALARAEKAKKPIRFTWQNQGAIAEHFAILCDCAKVVFDKCRAKTGGITLVKFLERFFQYLIGISQVPTNVLAEKTYAVKRKDWEKGGTRYDASRASTDAANVTNVLFAQVNDRRTKLERVIMSGGSDVSQPGHQLVSTSTGVATRPAAAAAPTKSAVQPGSAASIVPPAPSRSSAVNQASAAMSGVQVVPTATMPRGGPGPVKSTATSQHAAARQAANAAHATVKNRINAIVGGHNVIKYPLQAKSRMPEFIAACRLAKHFFHMQGAILLLLVRANNRSIRQEFDNCGGLVVVQEWIKTRIMDLLKLKEEEAKHSAEEFKGMMAEKSGSFVLLLKAIHGTLAGVNVSESTKTAWLRARRPPSRKAAGASGETSAPDSSSAETPTAQEGSAVGSNDADDVASNRSVSVGSTASTSSVASQQQQGSLDWVRTAPVLERLQLEYVLKQLNDVLTRRRGAAERQQEEQDNADFRKAQKHASHREDRLRSATLAAMSGSASPAPSRGSSVGSTTSASSGAGWAARNASQVALVDAGIPVLRAGCLPCVINGGPNGASSADAAELLRRRHVLGFNEAYGLKLLEGVEADEAREAIVAATDDSQAGVLPSGLAYDPYKLLGIANQRAETEKAAQQEGGIAPCFDTDE